MKKKIKKLYFGGIINNEIFTTESKRWVKINV